MNWQTKEQLDVEYVLNARATIVDKNTVTAGGRTFHARNLILGMGARPVDPDIPGLDKRGVFDFVSLVEELDYEPNRCVIIGGSKIGHGVRLVLPRHRVRHDDRLALAADADEVAAPRRRGPAAVRGRRHAQARYGDPGGRAPGVGQRQREGRVPASPSGSPPARRSSIETDFVFLGTGERPQTAEAVEVLGVEVGPTGRVVVDKRMRTNVPGVYAIGDMIGGPMEMFKARKSGRDRRAERHGRGAGVRLLRVPGLPAHHLRGHLGRADRGGGPRRVRRRDHHPDASVRRGAGHAEPAAARAPRARCSTRSASPS